MNAVVNYAVSDMERMARAFAGSKLFGVQNVDQALALCLVAQAEGRHPASAAQDYHIISGRPAKKADAMLRDFLAGGGKVEWHALSDEVADATFSHPAGGSARIEWTLKRAKTAGLTTPMWSKYPRQMLRSRVVSEGVRTVYPMATSGMYVPEEVQDFAPEPARAEMRDVTPPSVLDAPQDAPRLASGGLKRLTSAKAKDEGLNEKFKDMVNLCATLDEIDALDDRFDTLTAQFPLSWLDSARNQIILRREEIEAAAPVREPTGQDARGNPTYDDDTFPGDRGASAANNRLAAA